MMRISAIKAELMFSVARFLAQKHDNIILNKLVSVITWLNRHRHGKNTLDFLEENDSIDHLDFEKIDEEDLNSK